MRYVLPDGNIIIADQAFIDEHYPGAILLPEPTMPEPEPVPEQRHISVGSFFDRFGELKYPILADQDPAVQAVIKDVSIRKYIDLDRPDLPMGLQVLVSAGHAVDVVSIVESPVQEHERP